METLPSLELLRRQFKHWLNSNLFTTAPKAASRSLRGKSPGIYKKGKVKKAFSGPGTIS